MSYSSGRDRNYDLPHSVYRLFDKDGALLYIGMSFDLDARIAMHLNPANTAWCADEIRARYASHTSESHPGWHAAHAAEVEAIYTEAPEFNRQHNRTKWRWNQVDHKWVPVVGGDPLNVKAAVAALDSIDATDPERAHSLAEAVLLDAASPEIRAAYERVVERAGWWAVA